jgi:hypothetical protein
MLITQIKADIPWDSVHYVEHLYITYAITILLAFQIIIGEVPLLVATDMALHV